MILHYDRLSEWDHHDKGQHFEGSGSMGKEMNRTNSALKEKWLNGVVLVPVNGTAMQSIAHIAGADKWRCN